MWLQILNVCLHCVKVQSCDDHVECQSCNSYVNDCMVAKVDANNDDDDDDD